MLTNQLVISFDLKKQNSRKTLTIPSEVDLKTMKIYKLPNGVIETTLPLPIIHGKTIFIIHAGHDYKLHNRELTTSNPDLFNNKLLIEYGEEIFHHCLNCDGLLKEDMLYCPECGTKNEIEYNLTY